MRFKIDWARLIVGSKFTVFALFYFAFEGNFLITSLQGAYIWRGDLTEGFLRYRFGGLIFGGAYFRNFTLSFTKRQEIPKFFLITLFSLIKETSATHLRICLSFSKINRLVFVSVGL